MLKNNNQNPRLEAIKEFMHTKRDNYIRMVKRTEGLLQAVFGKEYCKTIYAEDILHEVFCDLIDGKRKWDMDKHLLEQVVMMDVRSEINNYKKKEMRYKITDENNYESIASEEMEFDDSEMDILINTKPEDIEGRIDADIMLKYCYENILADDADGQIILSEMIEGKTQMQIAQYLGIHVDRVESHIKRIRNNVYRHLPKSMLQNLPKDFIGKLRKKY